MTARRIITGTICFALLAATGAGAWHGYKNRADIIPQAREALITIRDQAASAKQQFAAIIAESSKRSADRAEDIADNVSEKIPRFDFTMPEFAMPEFTMPEFSAQSLRVDLALIRNEISDLMAQAGTAISDSFSGLGIIAAKTGEKISGTAQSVLALITPAPKASQPLTLSEMRARKDEDIAQHAAAIAPGAGTPTAQEEKTASWPAEAAPLIVEAVLVPRQVTVISSSQDGKIGTIPLNHGDSFKKGDLLIAYECADLEAERDMATYERDLAQRKAAGSDKLFKLEIISDIDRLGLETQGKQAEAKEKLFAARMQDCEIRAQFDGRVTNRLANPGEYTRTDRVLLEVASDEPLQAQFLVPSKWLRWVNVGAPVSVTIGETDQSYKATITRIYGEVDPVSQSIQMVATLDSYNDPLLPGMSGQAEINADDIRKAGIKGYLQRSAAR